MQSWSLNRSSGFIQFPSISSHDSTQRLWYVFIKGLIGYAFVVMNSMAGLKSTSLMYCI